MEPLSMKSAVSARLSPAFEVSRHVFQHIWQVVKWASYMWTSAGVISCNGLDIATLDMVCVLQNIVHFTRYKYTDIAIIYMI